MLAKRLPQWGLLAVLTLGGCQAIERAIEAAASAASSEDPPADAPAVEPLGQSPEVRSSEMGDVPVARQGVLGATVAQTAAAHEPAPAGPLGAALETIEEVEVNVQSAGWVEAEPSGAGGHRYGLGYGRIGIGMGPSGAGATFRVEAAVTVSKDPAINQAMLYAKATCQVGGERRASSNQMLEEGGPYGFEQVMIEKGEHDKVRADLFVLQDVVGSTPCQLEFRVMSPFSDKPLRTPGVWCITEAELAQGPCAELAPASSGDGFTVRQWHVDRTRQSVELTVEMHERVWLDRNLVVRSSCDRGGERLPRVQFAPGVQWGMLDPGDAVRLEVQQWQGWFGARTPCELTAEWWERDERGQFRNREQIGLACVNRFRPEPGKCPFVPPSPSDTALSVRKFDLAFVREPYMRGRGFALVAETELVAHEDLDGRYGLEVKGRCGKGRRATDIWLSPQLDVDPSMLLSGEVAIGSYHGWLYRGSRECEVELTLTPRDTSDGSPISLGKHCTNRRGSTPCA